MRWIARRLSLDVASRLDRLGIACFGWIVAPPVATITLCAALLLGPILMLPRIAFDADSRIFFSEESPDRKALDRLERVYGASNTVVIVAVPRNGRVFSADTLALLARLTDEAQRIPYASAVESLATYRRSVVRGDEAAAEPLWTRHERPGAEALARAERLALADREIVGRLVSERGDATAILVSVLRPGKDRTEIWDVAAAARRIGADARRAHPDTEFGLTGGVLADVTFAEAGMADVATLAPVMIALMILALLLAFRSWPAALAVATVPIASVAAALGGFVGAGFAINGATAGAPVIIMTICILDAAHVVTSMTNRLHRGEAKRAAIVAALRENNAAMFITSLTDVIGFAALNVADSPPLNDLGNLVSAGAVAGYLLSLTLLPAVLALLPAPRHREHRSLGRMMDALTRLAAAHRRKLLLGLAVAFVGLSAGMARIVFDDNFVKYFDERFAFRRDTDFYQQRLGGLHVINFALPSGEQHGITDPAYLRNVDRFAEWFRSQPKVIHVVAFSDTMKRLNMNLNGDDPKHYAVGESRRLNAQLLLLYELSVPQGRDLRSQIDVSKSTTLLSVILRGASSSDIQALAAAGEGWLAREAPAMRATGTGLSVAYAHISEANIRMMLLGTFVGLTLISATMFVVLRTTRLALLSLVPNLIPAAMAYGLWGYMAGEVNIAVSVVGSFTFGIIVDDTVHFVSKYFHARRSLQYSPEDATRHSFQAAGAPTVIASVVLISGFVVLCFSGFSISRQMGMLAAITIVLGLLVELFLLPSLLLAFGEKRKRSSG